jgi:glyoxylase-like metal-dependent hydrolase (beta-lactamase superfamily II)
MVLTEMGRGTVAVAILGTAVISCGGETDDDPVAAAPTTAPDPTVTPAPALAEESAEPVAEAPELRWERVSFDFVSAYVLARGNEVAIVDTGVSGSADRFDGALEALSVGWSDVDHVILTHLHPDHIGGLGEVLGATPDASAYAGEADVAGISSPRPLTPVNDGDEVFGLQIVGTPGHTAGHISVLDTSAGLLVAGDALNEMAGAITGPNPDFTDDLALADNSARRLGQFEFDTALFGHGEPVVGMADKMVADLIASL